MLSIISSADVEDGLEVGVTCCTAAAHRLITLITETGNTLPIVSLAYDVIITCFIEIDMDSLKERKTLIAMTVCCYKMMYIEHMLSPTIFLRVSKHIYDGS